MDAPVLPPADKYINRELSLLEFNWRVLDQARDPTVPILERLRFLCISCTNLDEFFEIRVASLKQRLEIGAPAPGPDKMTPQQLLDEIRHRAVILVREQYKLLNETILPTLASEQIYFLQRADWSDEQRKWLADYFAEQVGKRKGLQTYKSTCWSRDRERVARRTPDTLLRFRRI